MSTATCSSPTVARCSASSAARPRAGRPKEPKDDDPPPGADVLDPGVRDGPARGRDLRLRQAERAGHRALEGGRLVPGAVPTGGREEGLGPDLRAMYVDPRRRGPARDARLDVGRRRQPGHPRRGPGRRPRARAPEPSANPSGSAPRPRRPRSRPRSPDRGDPMIPLRDANPTRRTPLGHALADHRLLRGVRLGARAARERRRPALETFITAVGRRAGRPDRGLGPWRLRLAGDRDARDQPVPARRLVPPARQHALPVDLRQQRRGPFRAGRLPRVLPAGRGAGGPDPGRHRPELDGPDDRRVRGDRRDARRVLRALPASPGDLARLPRLLLPADRRPGDHRPRLLVRPPAHRRPDLAGCHRDRRRRRVLRPHRRIRGRRGDGQGHRHGRRPASRAVAPSAPSSPSAPAPVG